MTHDSVLKTMQMDLSKSAPKLQDVRPILNDITTQIRSLHMDLLPTIRLPMPDRFSDDPIQFRYWTVQVKNFLNAHQSIYPDDSSKIALYISLMKDEALQWVAPLLEDDDPSMKDLSLFMSKLERRFKEPACPVGARLLEGDLQYKVHWKGYRVSQQSWVSSDALASASASFHEYVRVFHECNPEQPRPHT